MAGFGRVAAGIERLTEVLARLAGLALLGMMLVVCYGVVMRYVLRAPVAWANEFARFSFLPVVALGLAYALKHGAHVATEFFVSRLSARARTRLSLFSLALVFGYAVVAGWAGWRLASVAFAKGLASDEAEIPLVLVLGLIPIGFLALALQALVRLRNAVSGDPPGAPPPGPAHAR